MGLKLYYYPLSPPSRSSLMALHALGLENELTVEEVNLMEGQQLSPDYIKVNPLHTLPTLEDDGFVVFDSHAINTYLVDKYASNDSLYPKDLQKRAIVDQMLHFENGYLMAKWGVLIRPIFKGVRKISQEAKEGLYEAYSYLETVLSEKKYMAGENFTLADIHLGCWVTTISLFIPVDQERYPKINEWVEEMKKLPYFEKINEPSLVTYWKVLENMVDL